MTESRDIPCGIRSWQQVLRASLLLEFLIIWLISRDPEEKTGKLTIRRFSPFAEIYSSHGCSENDDGPLTMNRHVHMGPRTGETTYEKGLEKGYPIGVIAAGDNHSVPGVFEHGSTCALAEDCTKEAIRDAFVNRRTYGVSHNCQKWTFLWEIR